MNKVYILKKRLVNIQVSQFEFLLFYFGSGAKRKVGDESID